MSVRQLRFWSAACVEQRAALGRRCPHNAFNSCSANRLLADFVYRNALSIQFATVPPHRGFSSIVRASADGAPIVDIPIPTLCAGCGVKLQRESEDAPGYYQISQKILDYYKRLREDEQQQDAPDADWGLQQQRLLMGLPVDASQTVPDEFPAEEEVEDVLTLEEYRQIENELGGDWGTEEDSDVDVVEFSGNDSRHDEDANDLILEERVASGKRTSGSGRMMNEGPTIIPDVPEGPPEDEEQAEVEQGPPAIVCARCYSLRHYGHIRSRVAESRNPSFELGYKVGRKIAYTRYRRAVLLCVVDIGDFDGSLPRAAVQQVLHQVGRVQMPDAEDTTEPKDDKAVPLGFRLVLAVNKVDLLPAGYSAGRVVNWVRMRANQGGLPTPAAVPLVSSVKGHGVRELYKLLREMVGARGDVWVIGAQNAGKSSLINALRRCAKLPEDKQLTTAVLPGTTLGMLKVDGLLPGQGHLYDTPGVPHPYQLTSRLPLEEVKVVLPRSRLRPRTYRIGASQTVLLGGLARVDVLQCPGATLYLSVWMSGDIPCWMGKTENAEARLKSHVGTQLYPPFLVDPSSDPPPLQPTTVTITGDSWSASSSDVAISGLGWVGVGVKGEAKLQVWAPQGVAITIRRAFMPDLAREFEKPGFSPGATKASVLQASALAAAKAGEKEGAKSAQRGNARSRQNDGRTSSSRPGQRTGGRSGDKAPKRTAKMGV